MENNKENALKFIEEMDKREGTESWTDSSDTLVDAFIEYGKLILKGVLKEDILNADEKNEEIIKNILRYCEEKQIYDKLGNYGDFYYKLKAQ